MMFLENRRNLQFWKTPFVSSWDIDVAPWEKKIPSPKRIKYSVSWTSKSANSSVLNKTCFFPSSIPWLGRSAGEGIGYPLQYSWASLVAQLVKNPPAMRETWVRSLGWEEKGHPLQYSGLENFMDCKVHGVAESRRWLSDFHFHRICFHEAWTYWQALWDKIDWTFVNC